MHCGVPNTRYEGEGIDLARALLLFVALDLNSDL